MDRRIRHIALLHHLDECFEFFTTVQRYSVLRLIADDGLMEAAALELAPISRMMTNQQTKVCETKIGASLLT